MTAAILALLLLAPASARAEGGGFKRRLYLAPEEIRSADSRTLAARLVERLRRECSPPASAAETGGPVGDDAELIMMIPASAVASILSDGFRNRHETLTTGGQDRGTDRFEAEQELAMARLPYDARGRELLPKYALLNVLRSGFGAFALPARYGTVAVVFKKEVMSRATWTYADSLDHSLSAGRWTRDKRANPVLARTLLEPRAVGDPRACVNYCEAQIWGGLGWSDVEYAMVRGTEPVPAALLASGAPVYRYTVSTEPAAAFAPWQTAQFERGKRVMAMPGALAPTGTDVSSASAAGENLRRGLADAALDDASLIARIDVSSAADAERLRLIGELAVRLKTAPVARALSGLLRSSDETTRALALYGLSELPWADYKPSLLAGLDDPGWTVQISAIALAAERRGDADVERGLEGLRSRSAFPNDMGHPHAEDVAEWLSRLDAPRFCR
jgi:hypothetical protein